MLKTYATGIALIAAAALFGQTMPEMTYNWDIPTGISSNMHIYVSGEAPTGRVPLKPGKAPDSDAAKKQNAAASAKDNAGIQETYCKVINHGGEANRAFNLHAYQAIKQDTWNKIEFSFIPTQNGKVTISIGSGTNFAYGHIAFISLAKLESSSNVSLQNPNFDKNLKLWNINPPDKKNKDWKQMQSVVSRDAKAPGGNKLKTCIPIRQTIDVKKDQEVTMSVHVYPEEYYKSPNAPK